MKGLKKVLGLAAAVVVPFAAPAIAGALASSALFSGTALGSFLGSTAGSALVGAGLGAGASALTGGNPVIGALTGGVGAGAVSALGGAGGLFGQAGAGAGQAAVPAGAAGAAAAPAGAGQAAVPAGVAGAAAAPAGAAAGPLAARAVPGGVLGAIGSGVASIVKNPLALAQLTAAALTGNVSGLSDVEKQLVAQRRRELEKIAATNWQLFEQQVSEARKLLAQADALSPDIESAFANATLGVKRAAIEASRGLPGEVGAAEQRRAAIRSGQVGAAAAAAEADRGNRAVFEATRIGLNALPVAAPEGAAGLKLALEQGLQERNRQAEADLARRFGFVIGSAFG